MTFGRRVKKQLNKLSYLGVGLGGCLFFGAVALADPPIPAPVQVIVDVPKTIQIDAESSKVKSDKPGAAPDVIEVGGAVQKVPAVPTDPVSSMPLSPDDVIEGSSGMELPPVEGEAPAEASLDGAGSNAESNAEMPAPDNAAEAALEAQSDTEKNNAEKIAVQTEKGGMWALRRALKDRLQKSFAVFGADAKDPNKINPADVAVAPGNSAGNADAPIAAATAVDPAAQNLEQNTNAALEKNQEVVAQVNPAENAAVDVQKNDPTKEQNVAPEEDSLFGVAPVADDATTKLWQRLQAINPDLKLADVSVRIGACGALSEALQKCLPFSCAIGNSGMTPIKITVEHDNTVNDCVVRRVVDSAETVCLLSDENKAVFEEEWNQYIAMGESIYAKDSQNILVSKANAARQKCQEEILARTRAVQSLNIAEKNAEQKTTKQAEQKLAKEEKLAKENLVQNIPNFEAQRAEIDEKKLLKKEEEKRLKQAKQKVVEQAISKNQPYFEYLDKTRKRQEEKSEFLQETGDVFKNAQRVVGGAAIPDEKNIGTDSVSIKRGGQKKNIPDNVDGVRKSDGPMDIAVRDTNQPEDFLTTQVQLESAYRALMAGQTEAAIGIYKQVLAKSSKNQTALFGMATAYHRNGQFDQARQIYTELLQLDPNNIEALNNFLVLAAEESPEDALIELKKLERLNSGFSPVAAQIGMIYFRSNDLSNAARYLNRAVTLSPENVTYRYNLAVIYDKLGRYSQAAALYQQVLKSAEDGRAVLPVSVSSLRERMAFIAAKGSL